MKRTDKPKQEKRPRLAPLTLHPLKAEEALGLFMQIDPAKLKTAKPRVRHKQAETTA
jgi:hypothetical protein